MAVSALELKPRNAVALFDAALAVCAQAPGVWTILLPSGALLTLALFTLSDAVLAGRPLVAPVVLWTAAWAVRAIAQGAAAHHVDTLVVGTGEATVAGSVRAALARAPGLVTASAVMLFINVAVTVLTLGIGFLFLGAHAAGYAAVMRGQGSAAGVYTTASRLLGPARHQAPWVRLMGVSQVLVAFNLHVTVAGLLYVARALLGFEVSFLDRFTSLDNPVWLATVAVLTFALFEPVRAATGALLLIDGRVRQEGLDLLAAVEQLPRRARRASRPVAVSLVVGALAGLPAHAQDVDARTRLESLIDACRMSRVPPGRLDAVDRLDGTARSGLERLAERLESLAYDEEDCDGAEAALRTSLRLVDESLADAAPRPELRSLVEATLGRPEFQSPAPPPPTADQAGSWLSRWWDRLMRSVWSWLRSLRATPADRPPDGAVSGELFSGVVLLVVVLGLAAGLGLSILRRVRSRPVSAPLDESGQLVQQPLEPTEGALARPAGTWAGLADELAARGEYREAVRHLYLALLSRLHHDGFIDYEPTSSNWDYLRGFKGPGPLRLTFRELTTRFDYAWYGRDEVTPGAWRSFRSLGEVVLVPATAGT